jgi:hypothetical protein
LSSPRRSLSSSRRSLSSPRRSLSSPRRSLSSPRRSVRVRPPPVPSRSCIEDDANDFQPRFDPLERVKGKGDRSRVPRRPSFEIGFLRLGNFFRKISRGPYPVLVRGPEHGSWCAMCAPSRIFMCFRVGFFPGSTPRLALNSEGVSKAFALRLTFSIFLGGKSRPPPHCLMMGNALASPLSEQLP